MLQKKIEVIARFKNSLVHSYCNGELLFSSKSEIFKVTDLHNPKPEKVEEIPWKLFQNISNIRVFDRFLKHSILQVHKTRNEEYLVSNGNSWWVIDSLGRVEQIEKFSETRPMQRGICESADGNVYVAEYPVNYERGPVRIFRTKDLRTFEVAWKFKEKSIRHIHALVLDPDEENRIWVLTGDSENECHFYYTDDNFYSLNCFLSDGQKSRATDLIIRDGHLYWGMDSPLETPYVISIKKESPDSLEQLCELPGPVYYCAQNEAGGMYLGTTVEQGIAVKSYYGYIYGVRPDNSWREVLFSKKDIFPQQGIFYFPRGVLPENFLIFSQRALKPYEGYLTITRDNAWS